MSEFTSRFSSFFSLRFSHNQHRTTGVTNDAFGGAPEPDVFQPGMTTCGQYD